MKSLVEFVMSAIHYERCIHYWEYVGRDKNQNAQPGIVNWRFYKLFIRVQVGRKFLQSYPSGKLDQRERFAIGGDIALTDEAPNNGKHQEKSIPFHHT